MKPWRAHAPQSFVIIYVIYMYIIVYLGAYRVTTSRIITTAIILLLSESRAISSRFGYFNNSIPVNARVRVHGLGRVRDTYTRPVNSIIVRAA